MLIFYAGAKYLETTITIVLSYEEYWAIDDPAVRYPNVSWHGAAIKVADEAARDAWIAAMDMFAWAADELGGICGGHHLVFCVNGMLDRLGSVRLHKIRDGVMWRVESPL